MAEYVLAIDQSTSSTKAVLFSETGKLIGRANADHAQYYPRPGWVEHNAEEIITRLCEAVRAVCKKTGVPLSGVRALGLSNQRETTVVWDRETGKPIHNAIVWQCSRAEAVCEKIRQRGLANTVFEKTGIVLSPYFPASKLKWLLDNVEGAREKANAGRLMFGTIDSWLVYRLCGGVHYTDYSNASRTQLMNIHTNSWDDELLEIFTIPRSMMPEIRDSNAFFGETDEKLFGARLPVRAALGDSHAALFGQACFEPGMTKATLGTGSSVMMNIGKTPRLSQNGLVTSAAWGMDGVVEYVFEGNINCAGDTIRWLQNELGLIENPAEAERLAVSVPDNGGVYLVPAFVGLGAPYWAPNARAELTGLSRGSAKAHVARAGLESIAYQIADIVELMAKDAGASLAELRADGGPSRNAFLMQFQSDIARVPVQCAAVEELSAQGAAYMAGLGAGLWQSKAQLSALRQTSASYTPKMPQSQREKNAQGWKRALAKALSS